MEVSNQLGGWRTKARSANGKKAKRTPHIQMRKRRIRCSPVSTAVSVRVGGISALCC